MDSQAAKEYYALLWKRVAKRPHLIDRAWWMPVLALSGFYALEHLAGSVFGFLIGWAITSLHVRLDEIAKEPWQVELMRHLHEHTDEAEAGKLLYEIQASVEKAASKWWTKS